MSLEDRMRPLRNSSINPDSIVIRDYDDFSWNLIKIAKQGSDMYEKHVEFKDSYTYRRMKELEKENYLVYLNFTSGDLEFDTSNIKSIRMVQIRRASTVAKNFDFSEMMTRWNKHLNSSRFRMSKIIMKDTVVDAFGNIFGKTSDGYEIHTIDGVNKKLAIIDCKLDFKTDEVMFCDKVISIGNLNFMRFSSDKLMVEQIVVMDSTTGRLYKTDFFEMEQLEDTSCAVLSDGEQAILIGPSGEELIPAGIHRYIRKSSKNPDGSTVLSLYQYKDVVGSELSWVSTILNKDESKVSQLYEINTSIDSVQLVANEIKSSSYLYLRSYSYSVLKEWFKFRLKVNGKIINMEPHDNLVLNELYQGEKSTFYTVDVNPLNRKKNLIGLCDLKGRMLVEPGNYDMITMVTSDIAILRNADNDKQFGLAYKGIEVMPLGSIIDYGITEAFKVTYLRLSNGTYKYLGANGKLYTSELDPFEYYMLTNPDGTVVISAKTYIKWITIKIYHNRLETLGIDDKFNHERFKDSNKPGYKLVYHKCPD